MAGGKLSPRQKMINMMYLVLMALLALNVSKEILKSFHLFEQSFNNAEDNKIRKYLKARMPRARLDSPITYPLLQHIYLIVLEI